MLHWRYGLSILVLLLLSFAARGEEAGDQLKPEEIADKFKRIERRLNEFRDLDRASRSAADRLTALEADVRRLRDQADRLDASLRAVRISIDGLRSDLAKQAATAAATESARVKVGPATPTGPGHESPAPGPPATAIVDQRVTVQGDFTTLTGTVENLSDGPLTFVIVKADFLDSAGNVIKTESVYTSPRVIGPRGKATFSINTRRDFRIRSNRLTVETK